MRCSPDLVSFDETDSWSIIRLPVRTISHLESLAALDDLDLLRASALLSEYRTVNQDGHERPDSQGVREKRGDPMTPVRLTSEKANQRAVISGLKKTYRERILEYLATSAPRTRGEIEKDLGIRISAVCPVVNACIKSDLIIELDERPDHYTGYDAKPLTLPDQPRLI